MTATADLIQRAMQYHAERRFHQAWWCYEAAAEQEPDSPFLWMGRGDLANDLLRFNEALTCYDRALGVVAGSPMIVERRAATQANLDAPRVSEGKGFAGTIKRMFGGGPTWNVAVQSYVGDPTALDHELRSTKWGEMFAIMCRVVRLFDDVPKAEEIGEQARSALVEQRVRPSGIQAVIDEVLVYELNLTQKKKESRLSAGELEFKNFEKTEDILRWAMRWTYTCYLLSDMEKNGEHYLKVHTNYMRIEARYPGLADAIWAARGKKSFDNPKLLDAIDNDRETLARLHDLQQRDPTAFLESLLAWVG